MSRLELRSRPPISQLEFVFRSPAPPAQGGPAPELEEQARLLLRSLGVPALAAKVRVLWNGRLRSCAGRADFGKALITLNPLLEAHGAAETDRTLRHELAHLLAHARAGRRRISPHGREWRTACSDLGIADEARCHTLPFPVQRRARLFRYRCAHCGAEFPRVRRIRRALACGTCCRRHNRGRFDARFRLHLCK